MEDGSAVPEESLQEEPPEISFDSNLAEFIPEEELMKISNDLISGIEADKSSKKIGRKLIQMVLNFWACDLMKKDLSLSRVLQVLFTLY